MLNIFLYQRIFDDILHPNNGDHPPVYQDYFDKIAVVTDSEYTIRRHGNISMPFYVHDVIGEQTGKFTPNTKGGFRKLIFS